MAVDIAAAERFVATHGRILDRHRLACLLADDPDDRTRVLAALDAHRNPDGGYGWGLEPDLRDGTSQPAPALHAFEAMADAAPLRTARAVELCDWLAAASLADGALPFALSVADPVGCAPFWVDADAGEPSLQITSVVLAQALRVAAHDPAVAAHRWLGAATGWCLDAIGAVDDAPHALVLGFSLGLLDELGDDHPGVGRLVEALGRHVPDDGIVPVAGGVEGECLRPLDLSPLPGRPSRTVLADDAVAADLERLASAQRDDGGWPVEWDTYSPQSALEWRAILTIRALTTLQANGVALLPDPRRAVS